MLNLPLSNWTEEDIKIWLEDYQGFPITQSNRIARTIYQSSKNGTPQLVCQSLEQELT